MIWYRPLKNHKTAKYFDQIPTLSLFFKIIIKYSSIFCKLVYSQSLKVL